MYQLVLRIGILLVVVGAGTIFLVSQIIKKEIEEYQMEEINTAAMIVTQAMELSKASTYTIEHLIDMKLLAASKGIAKELQNRSIEEVSTEELVKLKEYWNLYDISLFVREGDDIVVAQSSDIHEIGLSSKDWGYWFTAFEQLMSGQRVSVEEGYSEENYWVGPISRSDWDDKYLKYAYYYDETLSFMLNPYILDEEIYHHTFMSGPSQMIRNIREKSVDIEEIAIINVPAYLEGEEKEVIEPKFDLAVLYGEHAVTLTEDLQIFAEVMNSDKRQSIQFKHEQKTFKKYYIPLPHQRVMTIVLNLERQEDSVLQISILLLGAALTALLVIFIMIRVITKRQLKPLKEFENHLGMISKGNLTKKLNIREKNEWGWLADQINDMTQRISHLIVDIKKEIHSLLILSSLLSKQVNSSITTMESVSTTMTSESKILDNDLQSQVEVLQQTFNRTIGELTKLNVDQQIIQKIEADIETINQSLHHLYTYSEQHASTITEMNIMFYKTVDELTEAIRKVDQLSDSLNNKIEIFQVNDEENKEYKYF